MQNTVNRAFSLTRFLLLCRANIQSHWKSLALYTGIIILICILFVYNSSIPDILPIPYVAYGFLTFILFSLLTGLSSYLASSSLSSLKKRDSACHELMLPASRIEKFGATIILQALVIPFLLWLLVAVFAYFLYLFSGTFRGYVLALEVVKIFLPTKIFILSVLSLLLNQSFFVAGASFFNKRPMLKLISIGIGLMILSTMISASIFVDSDPIEEIADFIAIGTVEGGYNKEFWVVSGSLMGLTALFAGFSWRRFSRHVMP